MTEAILPSPLESAPTSIESPVPVPAHWNWPLRILFRFSFCYFLLYALPEPGRVSIIGVIPGTSALFQKYVSWWHILCPWIAVDLFHLSGRAVTYFPTGSGDTTLAYIQNLCYLVLAVFFTVVWSVLDRRRAEYTTLHAWFRIWIRYVLAFTLFSYGFAKVFPLQFQPPPFQKLIEPWGDFSPMGAVWSFMGASTGYIIFSGCCEVLGGALLVFRRTATLGALVSFGVLTNVVALNYFYDVPVKLYSTNLVLMAVFLIAPELPRLFRFFVLNQATEPAVLRPVLPNRWMRWAATLLWIIVVGWQLYNQIHGSWLYYRTTYLRPQRPALYGLYEVETFIRNGNEVLPLVTDDTRWRKFIVQLPNFVTVTSMTDARTVYSAAYDGPKQILNLSPQTDKDKKYPFTYSWIDPTHLILNGKLVDDSLSLKLRKVDTSKYLLLSRGFHWINELPFNR
jgi:hypothetical protein